MKIVLIGFMGSGKSAVARLLAERLSVPLLELDDLIVRASGRDSISAIFGQDGEQHFRDLESEAARATESYADAVISTGGGAIMREQNVASLRRGGGKIVLLDISFTTAVARLRGETSRPLFRDLDSARRLYDARLPFYRRYADLVIPADALSAAEVAEEVLRRITEAAA